MMIVDIALQLPDDTQVVAGVASIHRNAAGDWFAQWHHTGETPPAPGAIATTLRWLADALELAGLETTDGPAR